MSVFFSQKLAQSRVSWLRFGISAGLHVVVIAALYLIPTSINTPPAPRPENRSLIHLTFAPHPKPAPKVRVIAKPVIIARTQTAKLTPHKFELPEAFTRTPAAALRVEIAKPEPPRFEVAVVLPVKLDLPPAPEPPAPAAIKAPKPPTITTGTFGENNLPAAGTQPATRVIQSGGFDRPSVASAGTPGGGTKSVALGGFGSGTASAGVQGTQTGKVRPAGFADNTAPSPQPAAAKPPAVIRPATTPVEILSKPSPVYTAQARKARIEGEVDLEVEFAASGSIRVVRVVRGLGMGLDESATNAATRIKFRPGTQDGTPTDMRGIVHIVFKLSGGTI